MNNKTITIAIVMFVLILAGAIISFKAGLVGSAIKNLPSETEAKWIGEHSVLYSQTRCSHCIEQKKLFGDNLKYLNIIEEDQIQKFIDAGIESTPTWIINGEKYVGVQSIERLKELTGYPN